ncbi:SDR family oxidoreductase [Methylobacterium sp. E-065]|uniref:SDR family oxidoreductase n=1 Tax=Methylobacterium sp. E-065 TaxID=2836583 RepID=UPI001FB97BFA|nr:SDR family oxidoreductase [Methylobacterium sp. E-065]MCJ2016457.1 SDR family oxidoreductase [Methylobacterium sp. E-065]
MSRQIAIVTGASSGIGKVSARALARSGFAVVLVGRRAVELENAAASIRDDGGSAKAIVVDVTDPGSVERLFAEVLDRHGRVDLLFNNAGSNIPAAEIDAIDFDQWRAVQDAIVTSTFLCTREAFRIMKAQKPGGGRIINNGSISAHAPRPGSAPYTAAKHAITGLTRSTALDGRRYAIACGQIDVGNADTKMGGRMKAGVIQADGSLREEPVIDPEHVANAVLTMASLPLDANILTMTIMATAMPFVGRG